MIAFLKTLQTRCPLWSGLLLEMLCSESKELYHVTPYFLTAIMVTYQHMAIQLYRKEAQLRFCQDAGVSNHRINITKQNFCLQLISLPHIHIHIHMTYSKCIYGLVFRVPTPPTPPPNGMGPQVAPPSLLFASYWQHFWGPASYLLGLCSISDYQPRIY